MDNPSPTALFVVVNRRDGAILHAELKAKGWLNAEVEPMEVGEDSIGFPLLVNDDSTQEHVLDQLTVSARFQRGEASPRSPVDPHRRLHEAILSWMNEHGVDEPEVLGSVPSKWERLGELILLPFETMSLPVWQRLRGHASAGHLWHAMAEALKVTALGIQAPVANDAFRSSQAELLLGEATVRFLDHGITYTFDATKVMFSSGNITERRRIGRIDMRGETVIDAYAGVGYYTFPMLVHAGATHVHACEHNPASIAGLNAGAEANGVSNRLTVHEGDNAAVLPMLAGTADRCHLGLLPSSEPVWEACLLALKPTGGTLHVHMNVEEERIDSWCNTTVERFQAMADGHGLDVVVSAEHLEKVKWFAPRVRHVVLDVKVTPTRHQGP